MATNPQLENNEQQRIQTTRNVTLVGALVDTVLGIVKIAVGTLAHSHALVADGIHSLSDLLSDFFVLHITHLASHGPDEEHPYGHERFETVGTVILGFILVAVAGALAYENLIEFASLENRPVPTWPAVAAAAVSLVSKEWIYHYTLRAGKRVNSNLLIANAWHSRSDAWSSAVVLVAVACAMFGLTWLDLLAAVLVAIMIAKIGWDLTWSSLKELVDTSIEPEKLKAIRKCIKTVEGVTDVHDLRSRRMGQKVLLDLHIEVSAKLTVTEGHFIGEQALKKLHAEFDDISDITYHIDVENDQEAETQTGSTDLPMREEVHKLITESLKSLDCDISPLAINLHYLSKQIEVEVFLSNEAVGANKVTPSELQQALKKNLNKHAWFKNLKVWYG